MKNEILHFRKMLHLLGFNIQQVIQIVATTFKYADYPAGAMADTAHQYFIGNIEAKDEIEFQLWFIETYNY